MIKNINRIAEKNKYFREVLETGKNTQVVVMSIPPGSEIGVEVHKGNDQILYLLSGNGRAIVADKDMEFKENDMVLVKAGTIHNFVNTGDEDMKIITTYSPPHHPDGTIHKTKEEAEKAVY